MPSNDRVFTSDNFYDSKDINGYVITKKRVVNIFTCLQSCLTIIILFRGDFDDRFIKPQK